MAIGDGLLKIALISTIIVPVIVASGIAYEKMVQCYYRRIISRVETSEDQIANDLDQEFYRKYLQIKVRDLGKDHPNEQMMDAFKQLSEKSQRVFFYNMSMKGHLIRAMKLITDEKQMTYCLGKFQYSYEFTRANRLIKDFFTELKANQTLEEVTLDLRGICLGQTNRFISEFLPENFKKDYAEDQTTPSIQNDILNNLTIKYASGSNYYDNISAALLLKASIIKQINTADNKINKFTIHATHKKIVIEKNNDDVSCLIETVTPNSSFFGYDASQPYPTNKIKKQ